MLFNKLFIQECCLAKITYSGPFKLESFLTITSQQTKKGQRSRMGIVGQHIED